MISIFKSPFVWFIFTVNLTEIENTLVQYPIEIDSNVIVILKTTENAYHLFEMYNTGFYTRGKFFVEPIGYWNSSLHLKRRRRTDLSGVTLKATVVVTQSIVNETFEDYVERSKLSKSDTLHKLKYFTLLKYLRDMYQFGYDLSRTNSWGYLHNGSFDGMIGTLQRQETDIGGSPIFFRQERAKVVDATIEVWQSRPVFILRHPKHPGGYFTIFTRPLTARVWLCIVLVLATSSTILSMMLKLRVLMVQGDDQDSSASLAMLTIWSAICQQGSSIARSATSIKLVTFVTFVFTLTIYQYYNATVVSTLLRDPPKNIRTPKDLLKSNLKAGVHDVLYNKDFFKRTTDPIALEMYHKKIVTSAGQNFYSLEQGMAMVKHGGFAFLVDNSIAYGVMRNTFNEPEVCEAHEVALYPPQNMAAVVKKGSPYREHFAWGLRKMYESGLMRRIKSIWDEPRPACVKTPDTDLISVSLREFATPLVALLCGMFIAVIILAGEVIMHLLNLKRQALKLNKLINPKSKKQWYPSQSYELGPLPSVKSLTKVQNTPGKQGSRRIAMLNKMFMKNITDLMSTGTVAMDIVGRGIEVSKVQVTPDLQTVNVFWVCKGNSSDDETEAILNKVAGALRHELSTLRVMGEVPYIMFVKDKHEAKVMELDRRLAVADYGEDYTATDLGHMLKTEFTLDTKLSPEMKAKIKQLEEESVIIEEPIPEMTNNVFGLDHDRIMNRLMAARKRSKDAWSNLGSEPTDSTVISYRSADYKPSEVDTGTQKQELAEFLLKRQILQNKLYKQLRDTRQELHLTSDDGKEEEDFYEGDSQERYMEQHYEEDFNENSQFYEPKKTEEDDKR
ncbi:hypothetical protein O0L34_g7827 [Tuta absoluta]|nr:hypothetical protein O0L34_g7827 [Tuta absoluta]